MKSELAREFWGSRRTQLIIGLTLLGMLGIISLMIKAQQSDYQRRLDGSMTETVTKLQLQQGEILTAIELLADENRQRLRENVISKQDRNEIKKTVDQVKSRVQSLAGQAR